MTNPLRKIKVAICNHQADSPLYVWHDVWAGDLQIYKSMVIHDTECPYWDHVSLNNTNPQHTQPRMHWACVSVRMGVNQEMSVQGPNVVGLIPGCGAPVA